MNINEAAASGSQMNAGLVAGIDDLSESQSITFTLYQREVLPLDGWIFWLKVPGSAISIPGSLHYATELQQNEDETVGINSMTFTTTQQIKDFDALQPGKMYIGTFGEKQFSFDKQRNFYQTAGLYHYQGRAVYPALKDQLIDDPSTLDLADVVVSNSLPIWLTLNAIMPIYPSRLVPQDVLPPYASVEIEPGGTQALQAAPWIDATSSHYQLCKDSVKITIYGLRNTAALEFQDYVFQYSLDTDNIGIMSMPVIVDEKRTQAELGVIAMKKSFSLDVSYYQTNLFNTARKFITSVTVNYLPQSL